MGMIKPFLGCYVLLKEWKRTRSMLGGAKVPDYLRGKAGAVCVPQ